LFPESKVNTLDINEQPQYLAMKTAFFNLIWDEVTFPTFKKLERPIPYTADIEAIFESTDSINRYWEYKSILERAILKITKNVPILKRPKFELNLISLGLKASKWRLEQEKLSKQQATQASIDKFNKFATYKVNDYAEKYKSNYQKNQELLKLFNEGKSIF
jgi:hypothetical protein